MAGGEGDERVDLRPAGQFGIDLIGAHADAQRPVRRALDPVGGRVLIEHVAGPGLVRHDRSTVDRALQADRDAVAPDEHGDHRPRGPRCPGDGDGPSEACVGVAPLEAVARSAWRRPNTSTIEPMTNPDDPGPGDRGRDHRSEEDLPMRLTQQRRHERDRADDATADEEPTFRPGLQRLMIRA